MTVVSTWVVTNEEAGGGVPASATVDLTTALAVALAAATAAEAAATAAADQAASYVAPHWADVRDKPEAFPPVSHGHPIADVDGLADTLAGKANAATTLDGYGITDATPIDHVGSTDGHPEASETTAGMMPAAAVAKLDGIEAHATHNATNDYLLARQNHIGSQLAETISDFADVVFATAAMPGQPTGPVAMWAFRKALREAGYYVAVRDRLPSTVSDASYDATIAWDAAPVVTPGDAFSTWLRVANPDGPGLTASTVDALFNSARTKVL